MTWTIQTTDSGVFNYVAAGDTFALIDGATIAEDGNRGISATGTVNDTTTIIHGDVYARNEGLYLLGADAITGSGSHTVFIGETGLVQSLFTSQNAILFGGTNNKIQNHGSIYGLSTAVRFFQNSGEVVNYGTIASQNNYAVHFEGISVSATGEVVNYGTMSSSATSTIATNGTNVDLFNMGTMISEGTFGRILSTGTSVQSVIVRNGGDLISDSSAFSLIGSSNQIINFASGNIYGGIEFGAGYNLLDNAGLIQGAIAAGNNGQNVVVNSGTITGPVSFGSAADYYDGRGGTAFEVFGGFGDDVYFISDNLTSLVESANQGNDTVNSAASSYTLGDNFETLVLIQNAYQGRGNTQANEIIGNDNDNMLRGLGSLDTIDGGAGDDHIRGNGSRDLLSGDEGNDSLYGGRGNDTIYGRDDQDYIVGGGGVDRLIGGEDEDTFAFMRINDSTSLDYDTIVDFELQVDRIDLSGLGADLSFIGSGAFSGTGVGEVRVGTAAGGNTVMRVDVDGDGTGDIRVNVDGVTGLVETDFVL